MSYPGARFLADPVARAARAARIGRILADFSERRLPTARLLDVGAGHGLITLALARQVGFAVGIDVDRDAAATAAGEQRDEGVGFALASALQLPFKDECFDLVVCNHVYEHVPDPRRMMAEIARVLKPDGLCYFAGGHRLQLLEPHYRLPLLSWLPRWLSHRYVWLSGLGASYDETFLPPWRIRELFTDFGRVHDITGEVLRRCHRYGLGPRWLERTFRVLLPPALARIAAAPLPTYLWLLRK